MIKISDHPNSKIIHLLEQTIWGLKGPQFQHLDIAHRIQSNEKNIFFSYYINNKVVGTVTFFIRSCDIDNQAIDCIYCRYFSVSPSFRGQKIGEQLLQKAEEYFKEKYDNTPSLFYAYIDKKNLRSSKIAQNLNYDKTSEFRTHIFSRVAPKKTIEIKKIAFKELSQSIESKEFNTLSKHNIDKATCYGCFENGTLKLGVRVLPTNWKIERIEGLQGFLLKNIVSRIPILKRLFNREIFSFLALDFFYSENNNEEMIDQFLESILKTENKNIAITWFDVRDKRNKIYNAIPNKGLLEKMNGQVPANIHYECNNMSKTMEQTIEKNPFFIVSADLT